MLVISSSFKPISSSSSILSRIPPSISNTDTNKLSASPTISDRRELVALLAVATASFVAFAISPALASAQAQLANGEIDTMRPRKDSNRRSRPSSPIKDRNAVSSRSERMSNTRVSLLDREMVNDDNALFEELTVSRDLSRSNQEPRSFPYSVKQQCWDKAEKIKGRDPERWRRDSLGNTVFRKLVGCAGCLCHDYDHIVPYSKGGPSTLENCQVLQATVNRSKGNRTEFSRAELIQKSSYCRVSGRDMDLLELSAYGNVRRQQDSGGCKIQ